ncbi:glutathione S-transferase family protein [Serratia rubidaea]|nr:glutathione S-transferase family protein [Serratia rubidaea]
MIQLFTDKSPEAFKTMIALEELCIPYSLHSVTFCREENRNSEPYHRNLCGHTSAFVDNSAGVTLFESASMLLYLAEKTGRLLPFSFKARWEAVQWLILPEVTPTSWKQVRFDNLVANRYAENIIRNHLLENNIFTKLNNRLATQPYLAGDGYSIADIANFNLTYMARIINFDFSAYQNLNSWHERVLIRPAVKKCIDLLTSTTEM